MNKKYKIIYTVGCFDKFHHGHVKLLERLNRMGDQVYVGIHDDKSIEKLKNLELHHHDDLWTRAKNVKSHCNIIFIVADVDPTFYIKMILDTKLHQEEICFMRADDMIDFPGKPFVEKKMKIEYVSYTNGISSTMIRKLHSHSNNLSVSANFP